MPILSNPQSLPPVAAELETGNQEPYTGHKGTITINKLSIIIPAYNEENTISLILDRINEVKLIRNIEKEVIIVNDCSSDNTEAVIQGYISGNTNLTINYFKYIKHDVKQGKGAAIHTDITQATGD